MPVTSKITKKTVQKSGAKAPVVAASSAESSSKPSKSLKRKKEAEQTENKSEEKEPIAVFKKAKKDDTRTTKPSKARKTSEDRDIVVEDRVEVTEKVVKEKANKKKKADAPEATTPVPAVVSEEKTVKVTTKSKSSKAPATIVDPASPAPASPVVPKVKSILKKFKPSQAVPTSISRPRKAEASKSKNSKVAVPEPESNEENEDAEAAESNEESDEDDHLHGFSTDDDDSSDEEDAMDDEPSAFDVAKLPTIAKDDASVKRKLEKAKEQPIEDTGVLFLGRLPHGFYENQLKAYFSQFGNVTRLRISRNKKTGKSKHYGFIEFDSLAVAKIVAETMDNYLLMGHILRCKLIPREEIHPELWIGANRKWRVVPKEQVARAEHNKPRTGPEQTRAAKRLLKRQQERRRKLAKAGINYDFDAVSYKKPSEIEA